MFQVLENFSFIYPLLCTPCRHVLHNINMVTSYCLLGSDFGVVSLCVLTINFKYYTLFYNLWWQQGTERNRLLISEIKKNKLPDTLYISVHLTSMTVVSPALLYV